MPPVQCRQEPPDPLNKGRPHFTQSRRSAHRRQETTCTCASPVPPPIRQRRVGPESRDQPPANFTLSLSKASGRHPVLRRSGQRRVTKADDPRGRSGDRKVAAAVGPHLVDGRLARSYDLSLLVQELDIEAVPLLR